MRTRFSVLLLHFRILEYCLFTDRREAIAILSLYIYFRIFLFFVIIIGSEVSITLCPVTVRNSIQLRWLSIMRESQRGSDRLVCPRNAYLQRQLWQPSWNWDQTISEMVVFYLNIITMLY